MESVYLKNTQELSKILDVKAYSLNSVWEEAPPLQEEIALGDILPGEKVVVQIRSRIKEIPDSPYVLGGGEVYYTYSAGPPDVLKKIYKMSNKVEIAVQDPGISRKESLKVQVDKTIAEVGEEITYRVQLENTGNTNAENILITKEQNSCSSYLDEDTTCLMTIPAIEVGSAAEVIFKTKVIGCPVEHYIVEVLKMQYSYKDGKNQLKRGEAQVETPRVIINYVDFDKAHFMLTLESYEATVGEIVPCYIYCENKGNVTAKEVTLDLELPPGIQLLYEQQKPMHLPQIKPLESIEKKLYIKVNTFNRIPAHVKAYLTYQFSLGESYKREKVEMREVELNISAPEIVLEGKPLEAYALVGDAIKYLFSIKNKGNKPAYNLAIEALLPMEVKFIPHTLSINKVKQEEVYHLEMLKIEKIDCEEEIFLEVEGYATVHKQLQKHIPKVYYTFFIQEKAHKGEIQGLCEKPIIHHGHIKIYKQFLEDKKSVQIDEEVIQEIKLINEGTLLAKQILFYDLLPKGTQFVQGSLKIDTQETGVIDLVNGLNLGELAPSECVTIAYKIKVIGYSAKYIETKCYAEYVCSLEDGKNYRKIQTEYVLDKLRVASPNKQEKTYTIPLTLAYHMEAIEEIKHVDIVPTVIEWKRNDILKEEVELKVAIECKIGYKTVSQAMQSLSISKIFIEKAKLLEHFIDTDEIGFYTQVIDTKYALINDRQFVLKVVVALGEL